MHMFVLFIGLTCSVVVEMLCVPPGYEVHQQHLPEKVLGSVGMCDLYTFNYKYGNGMFYT